MGLSKSLGFRQSVAPQSLASSNFWEFVSIAKILDAPAFTDACRMRPPT